PDLSFLCQVITLKSIAERCIQMEQIVGQIGIVQHVVEKPVRFVYAVSDFIFQFDQSVFTSSFGKGACCLPGGSRSIVGGVLSQVLVRGFIASVTRGLTCSEGQVVVFVLPAVTSDCQAAPWHQKFVTVIHCSGIIIIEMVTGTLVVGRVD